MFGPGAGERHPKDIGCGYEHPQVRRAIAQHVGLPDCMHQHCAGRACNPSMVWTAGGDRFSMNGLPDNQWRRMGAFTDAPIPINLLFGLPNDRKVSIIVSDDGHSISYDLTGTVGMLPYLSRTRFDLFVTFLEPGRAGPTTLAPGPLLNHIAEPDSCSETLKLVGKIVTKSGRPCFNHPKAVARTTRDEVSRTLAGIEGLRVPRTIRVHEKTPTDVRNAIEHAGLDFPVLVRVAGFHLGMNLIRVDAPGEIESIRSLDRGGPSSLYVTEFCDFASADGLYRKYRVAVVGDDIFLRHLYIGPTWLVHRARCIDGGQEEEVAFRDTFDSEWVPRLTPMFREISRRLDLDFFGVDFNIGQSGQVLLFEANACMKILGYTGPKPNIWETSIARIKAAVEERLANPTVWRDFRACGNARDAPSNEAPGPSYDP
jgi:glutathione synthase/RimK-type ligase-like ATP-grasp enzyme